jgi:hypothetical protein
MSMEVSFSQESYRKESAKEELVRGKTGNGRLCPVNLKKSVEKKNLWFLTVIHP